MILTWNPDPVLLSLGPLSIHWYGILFMIPFIIGYQVFEFMYKREKLPLKDLQRLFFYFLFGTLIGARLGHVLFYEPGLFFTDPLGVFKIWGGGLASHGAGIGILVSVWLYSRKSRKQGFLQTLDKGCLLVTLSGPFIRLGNFFNSEIIGKPTSGSWGVVFTKIDSIPRHPAQLYEGAYYLLVAGLLFYQYFGMKTYRKVGFLCGEFIALIYAFRFIIEFWKENQVGFETSIPLLNMGQILSIPYVLGGLWLMWWSADRSKVNSKLINSIQSEK